MANIIFILLVLVFAQDKATAPSTTPQLTAAAKSTNDATQKISPAKDRVLAIDKALKEAGDKFSEDDYHFFYTTRGQICSELNVPPCTTYDVLTDLACSTSKNIPVSLILDSHAKNLKQEEKLFPIIEAIKKCPKQTVTKKLFFEELLRKTLAEKWKKSHRLISNAALVYLQSSDPQLQNFGFKVLQDSLDTLSAEKPLLLTTLKEVQTYASKVFLALPATAPVNPAWINWMASSVELFEQSGILTTYYKLYQKAINTPNLTPQNLGALIKGLCKYGRVYGQFNECANALKLHKSKLSISQQAELQLILSISCSEAGNQKLATETLAPLLNSTKPEERGFAPWAHLTSAFIQMNIPDMAKAKASLDQHFKLIDYSKTSNFDVFNRSYAKITRLSLLRETGDLPQAKTLANEILNDISNNILGTPMIKSWVVIEILMAAAQEKNTADMKKWSSDLRAVSNDLPDYQYMAGVAEAFEAAADGKYQEQLLDAARSKVGKDNPPFKRIETVLKNFSIKK